MSQAEKEGGKFLRNKEKGILKQGIESPRRSNPGHVLPISPNEFVCQVS